MSPGYYDAVPPDPKPQPCEECEFAETCTGECRKVVDEETAGDIKLHEMREEGKQ